MGRDFYNFFYDNWDPPKTEQSFTIYIREMPSPGMGNMIQVKINYDEIFRQRISPKQEYIKQLARMAVKQSENYIANYEEIQQQLGGEDMEGTGIY
jgi:curli production assembly/transport component CsgE